MNHRRHLKTILLLTALLIAYPVSAVAGRYKVIRVVDGDTIDINYKDDSDTLDITYKGRKERVRLLCVDTPESVHPDAKQNIPMGKVAADYAKKKLSGKHIALEFEGKLLRGDYGHLLAYVFVDGQNFNLDLVRQGLSPYYTQYGKSRKYDADFLAAEKLARKEKLNIWGDPELTEKYLRLKSKWGQSALSVPAINQKKISQETEAGKQDGMDNSDDDINGDVSDKSVVTDVCGAKGFNVNGKHISSGPTGCVRVYSDGTFERY
ncbi:MAG: thermonuclease family protein [Pseudomonadota bacterium]